MSLLHMLQERKQRREARNWQAERARIVTRISELDQRLRQMDDTQLYAIVESSVRQAAEPCGRDEAFIQALIAERMRAYRA